MHNRRHKVGLFGPAAREKVPQRNHKGQVGLEEFLREFGFDLDDSKESRKEVQDWTSPRSKGHWVIGLLMHFILEAVKRDSYFH